MSGGISGAPGQFSLNGQTSPSMADYDTELPPVFVQLYIDDLGTPIPSTATGSFGMTSTTASSTAARTTSPTTNPATTPLGKPTFGVTRPKPQPWYLRTMRIRDCQRTYKCRGFGGSNLN